MPYLVALASLLVIAFIIHVNIWYNRQRKAMTPEQRAEEDRVMDIEMPIW